MDMRGGKAWAFAFTLLLIWQTGTFFCYADRAQKTSGNIIGVQLSVGDHILLGADEAGNGGYLFSLLDTQADGITGAGLLFCSDPLGLEQTTQQFDEAAADHPDEDSRGEGYSQWRQSDLYIALNGQSEDGSTDTHGAEVAAAERFYQTLSANQTEWAALLPIQNQDDTTTDSGMEVVSLLSETEFEKYKTMNEGSFWYTDDSSSGFWLKTARAGYSWQVRYIYSDSIDPSLSSKPYYASPREKRSVRPALRMNLEAVAFQAGSGTADDPYRELALRPALESAELSGTARVGEELALNVSPAGAECTYSWYRDGELLPEETGSSYALGEDDVSCVLRGEARGSGDYYGKVEALTEPVEKGNQKPPEGDEVPGLQQIRITDSKLRVLITGAGLEYAITAASIEDVPAVKTETSVTYSELQAELLPERQQTSEPKLEWTSEGAFTGLKPDTNYALYVRRAEKKAWYASPPAAPISVRTLEEGASATLTITVSGWNPQTPAVVVLEPLASTETITGFRTVGTGKELSVTGLGTVETGEGLSVTGLGTIGTGEGLSVTGSGTMGTGEGLSVTELGTVGTGEGLSVTGSGIVGTGAGLSVQVVTLAGIELDSSYRVTVSKVGHLSTMIPQLSITADQSIEVKLACGDVSGDGSIDWKDRQILLNACMFEKAWQDAETAEKSEFTYDPERERVRQLCDLDGDGCVGLRDLYILMQTENYGKRVGAP